MNFFGFRKYTDGHNESFQTSGLKIPTSEPAPGPVGLPNQTLRKSYDLSEWQKLIVLKIKNKESLIVSVSPAAGKTEPVLRAIGSYVDSHNGQNGQNVVPGRLYEYFTSQNYTNMSVDNFTYDDKIPRVLFVVPTKVLVSQTGKDFDVIAMELLYNGMVSTNNSKDKSLIQQMTSKLVSKQSEHLDERDLFFKNSTGKTILKPLIVATYALAAQILNKYPGKIKTVFIDEFQEVGPRSGNNALSLSNMNKPENIYSLTDKWAKYGEIFSRIGEHRLQLILLTGSSHIQNLKQLTRIFRELYKIIIPDNNIIARSYEDAFNRVPLIIIPSQELKSHQSMMNAMTKQITDPNSKYQLYILFSIKRTSGRGIFTIVDELIKELPYRNIITDTVKKNMNLNSLIELETKDVVSRSEIEDLKTFKEDGTGCGNPKTLEDDRNVLYQSIMRGFGFIIGPMCQNHRETVMKLFRTGKINVLLATDSVGVGANLNVSDIYIPNLQKFNGESVGDVDESTKFQIVNRAGRNSSLFKSARIHVPPENVDEIIKMTKRIKEKDERGNPVYNNPSEFGNFLINDRFMFDFEHVLRYYKKKDEQLKLMQLLLQ